MANKKKNKKSPPLPLAQRISNARDHALATAWTIFFTVLLDKEGYAMEDLQRVWKECEKLSESIAEGRINVVELRRVLVSEYGVDLD